MLARSVSTTRTRSARPRNVLELADDVLDKVPVVNVLAFVGVANELCIFLFTFLGFGLFG